MKITCLKYAQSVYGIEHIFKDAPIGEMLPISFCVFLIETENRKILVDAGCDECDGFEFKPFRSIRCLLNDCNLDYEDFKIPVSSTTETLQPELPTSMPMNNIFYHPNS